MKRFKRTITAADENPQSEALHDMISGLEDDFDYIISGLEKLDRSGESGMATGLASRLAELLDDVTIEIADTIGEE